MDDECRKEKEMKRIWSNIEWVSISLIVLTILMILLFANNLINYSIIPIPFIIIGIFRILYLNSLL